MSAVSKNVTPTSSAASTTARVPTRSTRMPKLWQPRPTTETSGPSFPSRRICTDNDGRASGTRYRRLVDGFVIPGGPLDVLQGRPLSHDTIDLEHLRVLAVHVDAVRAGNVAD